MAENPKGYMPPAKTPDWSTPPDLLEKLAQEFGPFTMDPCPLQSESQDGLLISWEGERVFVNPPYGRPIVLWIEKAILESRRGALVVMLLPARTDTAWFHDLVWGKAEIRFLRGRLKFGDGIVPAPFPSMLAIYRPKS